MEKGRDQGKIKVKVVAGGEGKREEEEECELATLKLLDIYSRIGQ